MTPEKRLQVYQAFGRRNGLSEEDCEDFAQDAFVRHLEAEGAKLVLKFVFADFMRTKHGRPGSTRHSSKAVYLDQKVLLDAATLKHELIGVDSGLCFSEALEICAAKAKRCPISQYTWVSALAVYFGTSSQAIERLLRRSNLHTQSKRQTDQARRVRDFQARLRRSKKRSGVGPSTKETEG
jgi:hypothetical protein